MQLKRFENPDYSLMVRFYQQDPFPTPGPNVIFVFGSNLRGRHGAGAALAAAKHYGAIEGVGVGMQGRSYGIPTKDEHIQTLSLQEIEVHVKEFVKFTHVNPHLCFMVTPIGTGLAGYSHHQIAPMFKDAMNCWMPLVWLPFWTVRNTPMYSRFK